MSGIAAAGVFLLAFLGGILGALAFYSWRNRPRKPRVDAEDLETRLAAAEPSPILVTVVRRPSEEGYMVIADNPTRTRTSSAGHPLPESPWNYGPFWSLAGAQGKAYQLRRKYALLQLPDVPIGDEIR